MSPLPSRSAEPGASTVHVQRARDAPSPTLQDCQTRSIMKKVFSKASLPVSALGEGFVLGADGVYKYTSTPAHDSAVLAAISPAAAPNASESDDWPLMGDAITNEEIDKLLATSPF